MNRKELYGRNRNILNRRNNNLGSLESKVS